MKRKKKRKDKASAAAQVTCKNCPTTLILDPDPPPTDYRKRHRLCTACMANEIDALNEKLTRGGIVNEDVEAQNSLMVKALFFYGDKRNYGILGGTRIRTDKGQQAREALASGLNKEALGNVRSRNSGVYKALEEIQELTERHHHGEGGWSNMDMCEIWTITEGLLMKKKAGEC